MYATFTFDTEDVYYPPEYHIDDIPGWLAEIMSEVGVRGTFCVFAEKARTLKQRGRQDVLEKMAAHDIASHQMGNVRPLIPEILQDKGWADGLEAMRAYEDKVAEDIRDAFGCDPVAISRHNAYFAPQHVAVGGERGMPYIYGVVGVGGSRQPTWYAGTLNMPSARSPDFSGFDEIYSCDSAFEERLATLERCLGEWAEGGVEYVNIFGCHPVKVMACGWIERYCLVTGQTRTPEQLGWRYAVKTPQDEERAKANFRRLCQFIKSHPDLEVVGTAEAYRLFSTQPADITRDELTAYAEEVTRAEKVLLNVTFSPAELLTGLVESLIHAAEHGDIPLAVPRRDVLGPVSRPVLAREADIVTHDELVGLCRQALETITSTGHLPANVTTANARVGVAQLLMLSARAYLALARYEKYAELRVLEVPRYPDAAWSVDDFVRRRIGEHWAYDLDFSCERLAEHARLQSWTLKPAWLRPPRRRIYGEERITI